MTFTNIGIEFSRYFIHPDYEEQQVILGKDIYWELYFDFKVGKRTPDNEEIIIKHNLKLFRKSDKLHISGLITQSTFLVSTGIQFEEKKYLLEHLININIGHMLGGWIVKQENISMSCIYPSNYYRLEMIENDMKQFIFEEWI